MSRFNATKVSSRFFNSNNHTLPVTFYNKFSNSANTDVEVSADDESTPAIYTAYFPESRSVVYPPTNAYYWKGSVEKLDTSVGGFENWVLNQRLAAWWPLQTVENNKLVLRWTSLTTKDYKFDSTLTKTRVSTKNSAEISQWHYPKIVDPGFSYVVWGRDTTSLDDPSNGYALPANPSIPWIKYGVVKDKPSGVMEFVFNDRSRKMDDQWTNIVKDRTINPGAGNFQWMITIENSNYEPPATFGFATSGVPYDEDWTILPGFPFVVEPYYGYSQWVVAMSPWKRLGTAGHDHIFQGDTMSEAVYYWDYPNLSAGAVGWEDLTVCLVRKDVGDSGAPTNDNIPSSTPGVQFEYMAPYFGSPSYSGSYIIAWKGNWDNSQRKTNLSWLEDVLNFAGREIETKYAFKGFNGESISALHHLDTSSNTDFTGMFQDAQNFNQDIGFLDFTGANIMEDMFNGANKYMQDMSGWKVSLS